MVGILSFGAYVPLSRLQRSAVTAAHAWFAPGLKSLGKGERAMACWDEDAITMAVEAGRDCLAGIDRRRVARVSLASSSHPFVDRQNSGVIKEALNLQDDVAALDIGGSQRAGTSALLDAFYAVKGGAGEVLCIASEKRPARPGSELELITGDAAVALLIGEAAGSAEFLGGHSLTIDFVDHFRSEQQAFDYNWEARWIRDEGFAKIAPKAVAAALNKAGVSSLDVSCFVMGAPMKGVDQTVAKLCSIPADRVAKSLTDALGDAGTAQPLFLLAQALETARAGEILVVVGFGQGCDALVFRATGEGIVRGLGPSGWLARRRSEDNYLKFLAFNGLLDLELGMRAELDQKTALTALYRNRKAVMALVGGKCSETGAVQFPASVIGLAQNDRARGTLEEYPLADLKASIITFTADSLAYSPNPPVHYGAIEFEGGGRMTVEFADVEPGEVAVGTPVRMMFRIKARDERRGFIRYFWKAAPDYRGIERSAQAAA